MTISEKDLFLAILSMDSYNRSYGAGITGLGGLGSSIGTATILTDSETTASTKDSAQAAGFYAVAYDTQYGKVISYRGTDSTPAGDTTTDATRGWPLGGGDYFTPQTALSIDFLDAVQADTAKMLWINPPMPQHDAVGRLTWAAAGRTMRFDLESPGVSLCGFPACA